MLAHVLGDGVPGEKSPAVVGDFALSSVSS